MGPFMSISQTSTARSSRLTPPGLEGLPGGRRRVLPAPANMARLPVPTKGGSPRRSAGSPEPSKTRTTGSSSLPTSWQQSGRPSRTRSSSCSASRAPRSRRCAGLPRPSSIRPPSSPLRSPPRSERDLAIAVRNSHLLAYTNVSRLPDWLSDALCRIATGEGFATRTLYSDDDETVIGGARPILLNGIEDTSSSARRPPGPILRSAPVANPRRSAPNRRRAK